MNISSNSHNTTAIRMVRSDVCTADAGRGDDIVRIIMPADIAT